MKLFPLLLTALLLLSAQIGFALPPAFQADYTVKKGSMKLGNLQTTLKYSGNKYSYHKKTKATGLAALLTGIKITENTDGTFAGHQLTPQNYLFNQSRHGKSKIDKAAFRGDKVAGAYKGKPYHFTIKKGTQDRASLEIMLAQNLSQNKAQLNYQIVGRGEQQEYKFQKLGHEKLKTPAGTFNTIKVKVIRKDGKRNTTFWMAKELGYMPVKVVHREKKDLITSIIKKYKKL
ncbi:MAG TPA: DUF3108 domain-containing protein [Leucothrix sp.]|nr:DUF3108 domain-containing protein [Leucothrix sp.]